MWVCVGGWGGEVHREGDGEDRWVEWEGVWMGGVCGWVGVCIESVNGLECAEEYVGVRIYVD